MLFKWLPVISADRCTGCGLCVHVCTPSCLKIELDVAVLTDPNVCGSEDHCIPVCNDKAIQMEWVAAQGDKKIGQWMEM